MRNFFVLIILGGLNFIKKINEKKRKTAIRNGKRYFLNPRWVKNLGNGFFIIQSHSGGSLKNCKGIFARRLRS